jgi:hypothetical protein
VQSRLFESRCRVIKTVQYQWSAESGWNPGEPEDSGTGAQLVLLFGAAEAVWASRSIQLARARFPAARVFGCTTGGEIHGRGVGTNIVSLAAVTFEHTHIRSARVRIEAAENSLEAGQTLARSFPPQGLRHVFVLSDGLHVNGTALVNGLNAALPCGVTLSGGFASDDLKFVDTLVWGDGPPERNAVVALGFYGDRLKIGMAATGGWDAFGTDRKITRSRGNVLYELDNKPALALYKQYLGEHAVDLPAAGLHFPLELSVGDGQRHILRALIAVDEVEQSVTFGGDVPEGAYARLMFGNVDHLVDGAEKAARETILNLGMEPEFAFLVSCSGRRPVLKQRIEEEVEAVGDVLAEGAALAGFYSYGEIAPAARGGPAELHNQTMAITALAEV